MRKNGKSETLIDEEVIDTLFYRFNQALDEQGVFAQAAQVVEASVLVATRLRNSGHENCSSKRFKINF